MTKDKLKNVIAKKHSEKVAQKELQASREVMAKQTNVLAKRLADKLDLRMEKILADAEKLVKKYFPARYVSASLTKLQKQLIGEGISCTFDKSVTKEAIKKTAKSDITAEECDEAIQKIAQTVVAETEDTLDACDKAIKNLAKKHFPKNRISTAHVIRKTIEQKMQSTGLHCRF